MLYFMKPLSNHNIDTKEWKPFIKNQWFRMHFMYFVYGLQIALLICSIVFGVWKPLPGFLEILLFICVFVIHELIHIAVIYKAGDISITRSNIFFWIASGAVLTKLRFLIFMSLPFIVLTAIPIVLSIFFAGALKNIIIYIMCINSIISGSDIINTVLIAIKPTGSLFYRGYYKPPINN